jgi:2-oxo-3-(phosphooxy)propyl 3-oxoalkanoate synthase
MTAGVAQPTDRARPPELAVDRTIDRALVHRASVAEVFVTDIQAVGGLDYAAAAQLPLCHGYYSDHVRRPAVFDPVLLLEVGRQVGIAGAHLVGVPSDVVMLVGEFSLRLHDPRGLLVGRKPGRLVVDTVTEPLRVRGGRVRRGVVRQQLHLDGALVGTHTMECQLVSYAQLDALRHTMRGTPAPSTKDMSTVVAATQVAAHLVARVNPLNVVLSDVTREAEFVSAAVTPRYDNHALFDHDYDHIPAMTLTEAARQLALVAVDDGTGAVAAECVIAGIEGRFHRFAELDEPLVAVAEAAVDGDVLIAFQQGDDVIAEFAVSVLTPGAVR